MRERVPTRSDEPRYRVDVLVIGAGPAGGMAAREAARAGARVLLVERKREVGLPVRCAEYVPWGVVDFVRLPAEGIAQRVRRLVTRLPSGDEKTTEAPGFLVDRAALDRWLAHEAVEAGAVVWTGARAQDLGRGGVRIRRDQQTLRVQAKVLIGADGPTSPVARWMGNPEPRLAVGVQYTLRRGPALEHPEIHFGSAYPGGYAWVFPKGTVANAGVALDPALGRRPRASLDRFVAELVARDRLRPETIVAKTGGFIPIGGLRPITQKGRRLLAGDAAGHTHPVTGAGVYHALVCGWIAGGLAAKAVSLRDPTLLEEYEPRCRAWIGKSVDRALARRNLASRGWRSGQFGDRLVRQTWVAFHEYYQDAA